MREAMTEERSHSRLAMPSRRRLLRQATVLPVALLLPGALRASPEDMREAIFETPAPAVRVGQRFELSVSSGIAEVETRIRISAEQDIVAVAGMADGSLWSGSAHIVVTEAACIDALI